jgi:hypothetical protein
MIGKIKKENFWWKVFSLAFPVYNLPVLPPARINKRIYWFIHIIEVPLFTIGKGRLQSYNVHGYKINM